MPLGPSSLPISSHRFTTTTAPELDGAPLPSHSKTVRLWDAATGVLQQTSQAKGEVTDVKFSAGCSYLNTNLGYLKIQTSLDTLPPGPTGLEANVFRVERQWVTLGREKALWLPPEYRPCCSAVKDNSLALGLASGRVSILKFSL